MGDDGICYDCYSDKTVTIHCMGHDEVFKRCPNRYTDISGCGSPQSGLTCLNKSKEEINKLERKLTSRFFGKWEEDKNFINFNNHTCQNDWGVKY